MSRAAQAMVDRRAPWQIAQGERCGCAGVDDMCPCQNEDAPWKYGLAERPVAIDWQARADVLLAALRQQRAWVQHWQVDRAHGLKPTEGSLAAALRDIDASISKAKGAEQ